MYAFAPEKPPGLVGRNFCSDIGVCEGITLGGLRPLAPPVFRPNAGEETLQNNSFSFLLS
jgi:hypothetical protein